MKTLLSIAWFICGVILATKWYKNSEKSIIRMGNAMNRTENKFWDWCYYLFLSLVVLSIPFGLLLMMIKGIGVIAKYVVINGGIGVIIYSIYCKAKRKNNIIFTAFKSNADNKKDNPNNTKENEE